MNIEEIQLKLQSIPEVVEALGDGEHVHGAMDDATSIVDVAEAYTKMLRKLGVQQMRDSQQLASMLEEPLKAAEEIREAWQSERQRAAEAERQLKALAQALIANLDLLDRVAKTFCRMEGMESWLRQIEDSVALTLKDAKRLGFVSFGAPGEPFDVQVHDIHGEALFESGSDLRVESVISRGYAWKGHVLRRAEVTIHDVGGKGQ